MASPIAGPGLGVGVLPTATTQVDAPQTPAAVPGVVAPQSSQAEAVADGYAVPTAASAAPAAAPYETLPQSASLDSLYGTQPTPSVAPQAPPSHADQAAQIRAALRAQAVSASIPAAALAAATPVQRSSPQALWGESEAKAEPKAPQAADFSQVEDTSLLGPHDAAPPPEPQEIGPPSGPAQPTTASIIQDINNNSLTAAQPLRPREDPLCADMPDHEYELYSKICADDYEAGEKFLLQQKMSRISELATLLSNIAKSRHDASMSIVNNIR